MDSKQLRARRRALGQLGGGLLSLNLGAVAQTPTTPQEWWLYARTQLVLNPRVAYFDTAQFGPNARAVLAGQYRAQEALHSNPTVFYQERYAPAAVQALTQRLANWLDIATDELCFTRSGPAGLMQCAQALNLQAGDEVLLNAQLPACLRRYWVQQARQRGLVVKIVQLPVPLQNSTQVLAAFDNAAGDRSRLLVCSHLQMVDGAVLPVRELCQWARQRGMISLIEGSLAFGALQFSLRDLECDVYAASLSHWLNAPQQTGLLFVRLSMQPLLQTDAAELPAVFSNQQHQWPQLLQRWPEDFIALAPQFQALPLALSWQESIGRALLEARLRELQTYLRLRIQELQRVQILTPQQPGMWLHTLSLRAPRYAGELAEWLQNNDQVTVSAIDTQANGLNALRISLHIYNSHDEIERLLQGLQRALRAP